MLDTKGRRLFIGDGVKVILKPKSSKRTGKVLVGVVALHCSDDLIAVARDDRFDFCYADDIVFLVRIADEPQCVCAEDPRGKHWCHGYPAPTTSPAKNLKGGDVEMHDATRPNMTGATLAP